MVVLFRQFKATEKAKAYLKLNQKVNPVEISFD
jgi:hypothetical protein